MKSENFEENLFLKTVRFSFTQFFASLKRVLSFLCDSSIKL